MAWRAFKRIKRMEPQPKWDVFCTWFDGRHIWASFSAAPGVDNFFGEILSQGNGQAKCSFVATWQDWIFRKVDFAKISGVWYWVKE